ncbi:MAG: hypothetical protein U0166_22660 [Acidobacteriota bacterium]
MVLKATPSWPTSSLPPPGARITMSPWRIRSAASTIPRSGRVKRALIANEAATPQAKKKTETIPTVRRAREISRDARPVERPM